MKLPILALAALSAAMFVLAAPVTRTAEAAPTLEFPVASCNSNGATVAFFWEPLDAGTQQWLDISTVDDTFAPDTFVGAGPFSSRVTNFTWLGIKSGVTHYWRINTLTSAGWVPSAAGVFVPCGAPALLWGPTICQPDGTATVVFHWAPSTDTLLQWVDVSTEGDSFKPGTYEASPPMQRPQSSLVWEGFASGVPVSFRVNAFTLTGWKTSQVAGFEPDC
jgi:hypothetical protein